MLEFSDLKEMPGALSKLQAEIEKVGKDTKGHNYKYAELSGILEKVKPVLKDHGFSLIQHPTSSEGKIGVETMLLHSSGEFIRASFETDIYSGQIKGAQAIGSHITYYRRYAVLAILNIAPEDDDAASVSGGKNSTTDKVNAQLATAKQKSMLKDLLKDKYNEHSEFIETKMTIKQASEKIGLLMGDKK